MAFPPEDPARHRRTQRRRALVGWVVGVGAVALLVVAIVAGAGDKTDQRVSVPYGETMSSGQYDDLTIGEDENAVLEGLNATGRPESRTLEYVLVLFPPREADVECTFWEFSDQPQIFARLCFSDSELVQKMENDVHRGFEEELESVTT
jgi:hypothetical protein